MKKQSIFIVFFAAFAVGAFWAQRSWDGVIYINSAQLQNQRTPAAIRKDLDFSVYEGQDLINASQKRLVSAARIIAATDSVGLELGHFVTRGADGQKILACDFFNKISMHFESADVSEGGVKPEFEVEGPCSTEPKDITRIAALWVPVSKITGEKPTDLDISYPEASETQFRFKNMSSVWPKEWSLKSVRLFSDVNTGREVRITPEELHDILKKPLVMRW